MRSMHAVLPKPVQCAQALTSALAPRLEPRATAAKITTRCSADVWKADIWRGSEEMGGVGAERGSVDILFKVRTINCSSRCVSRPLNCLLLSCRACMYAHIAR